jgi:hypothetical protein
MNARETPEPKEAVTERMHRQQMPM